jgi:IS30 family transposase
MTLDMKSLIGRHLCQKWSPEQITGTLKASDVFLSHETIYRHIWKDKKQGGQLYKHLRRKGKKYGYRGNKRAGRGCIPHRVDIAERPAIVERKARLGDFEADTIIGAQHQGALLTLVDRKSKLTLISKLKNKTAQGVVDAIRECLDRLPYAMAKTMTFDNGKEFSMHEVIGAQNRIQCFFATPYRSWERGLNEHTNGLIRQFLPKKTNLLKVPLATIKKIEDLLNNRPRKVLGYRTPNEVLLRIRLPQKIALQC